MSDETPKKLIKPNRKLEHRVFAVEHYFRDGSFKSVQDRFKHEFDTEKAPYKSRIQSWVKNFRTYGTVNNLNSKDDNRPTHSGRPRIRLPEVIAEIESDVEQSPRRSLRKRSQVFDISKDTLARAMKEDIGLYPYRIQTKHQLTQRDKTQRLEMCQVVLDKAESSGTFINMLWTSDEAHFDLHGRVNSKTNVFWGSHRPDIVAEKPLHSERVTVWAGIGSRGIIGPFFFEEHGENVTVTKERYVAILELFWKELTDLYPGLMSKFWFQQDGASSHTSIMSQNWLKDHFQSRVVSLKMDLQWPPHSPDLSPPDFFLWGHLKDKVYKDKPETLLELKESIREEIRVIPRSMCKRVMANFVMRLKKCLEQNGAHVEHLL